MAVEPQTVGAGIGLSSEYVERGLSRSDGRAALMADGYARWDNGWQASLGLATWRPQAGRSRGEYTLTVARSRQFDADWTAAAAAARYGSIGGTGAGRRSAYTELSVSLAWREHGHLRAAIAPRIDGTTVYGQAAKGWSHTLEAGWHAPLAGRLSADVGLGHYAARSLGRPGYTYASIGLGSGWGPVSASLSFVGSNGRAGSLARTLPAEVRRSRWIGSVWLTY